MKDLVRIWNRATGREYATGNAADRELKELSSCRYNRDIDTSTFTSNLAECEGLNSKFDDLDFNERKDAIINRLFEQRRHGHVGRQPKCLFILLMLGFFALASAVFILIVNPYDFLFKQKVTLQDGGEIFEIWRKPEVDLYTRIFLFNVTNSEEFMSGQDTKLKMQEVGPYVYKEALEHQVVGFNDNGTLSAIPKHPLTWVEELSEGHHEDDMVIVPNIALLSIANVVYPKAFLVRMGLNNLIRWTGSQPLVKMTAKEFMMGYKNGLMTLGNSFMPGWIYFDKLGLIDRMYDFNGDYETIFTGEGDVSNSGLIDTYRGSTDLPQWPEKHCSNLQYASDGTKFKGGLDMNTTALFFRKSLCRAATLNPVKQGVKNGLSAIMYTFEDNLLDNGKVNKKNQCFCRNGKCLPSGLLDVTDCYYGFPIALSYPHFWGGDEVLFDKVEGLTPNAELHQTRFWIQPESGLPLDVSTKFQINMALENITNIVNAERFANMYLPLLWFDIRMYSLPEPLERRFQMYLNILPVVEQSAMYVLFVTGTVLVFIAIYRLTFKIMFKTFDTKKKQRNFIIGKDLWLEKEKNCDRKKQERDTIYLPCEIPLNESSESEADPQFETERRPSLFKTHTDRLLELGHKLGDKVYDSVGNVRDLVKEEFTHVRHIFNERKNSLINQEDSVSNYAFKSDSGEDTEAEYKGNYKSIRQSDSDDDCRYLEVLDDGSEFDDPTPAQMKEEKSKQLQRLDSDLDKDKIVYISD